MANTTPVPFRSLHRIARTHSLNDIDAPCTGSPGFPRLQPIVVAPADFVPFVAVVSSQRTQDYGNVKPMCLNEPRNINGIGIRTHHAP